MHVSRYRLAWPIGILDGTTKIFKPVKSIQAACNRVTIAWPDTKANRGYPDGFQNRPAGNRDLHGCLIQRHGDDIPHLRIHFDSD